ncbi:MAG TPA: CopG family transcriptional regulator, partial [Gaiellaceae bacterium]|nr:CopG family transcriptional regulator [Gaiellaceae bacterium]
MKRTTIMLSDDTAARVEHEARRRGVSVAAVVREAVERHLQPPQARRLPFVGIGEGALADDAS